MLCLKGVGRHSKSLESPKKRRRLGRIPQTARQENRCFNIAVGFSNVLLDMRKFTHFVAYDRLEIAQNATQLLCGVIMVLLDGQS